MDIKLKKEAFWAARAESSVAHTWVWEERRRGIFGWPSGRSGRPFDDSESESMPWLKLCLVSKDSC